MLSFNLTGAAYFYPGGSSERILLSSGESLERERISCRGMPLPDASVCHRVINVRREHYIVVNIMCQIVSYIKSLTIIMLGVRVHSALSLKTLSLYFAKNKTNNKYINVREIFAIIF